MTSLKTSIKTITYLSDIGCLEIQGASLIICYCASFWLLAQTLAYIPTGIAYAIWSGVGIVLISLLSWGFFGQRLDLPAIIGMMLICAGVLVINLLSRSAPH